MIYFNYEESKKRDFIIVHLTKAFNRPDLSWVDIWVNCQCDSPGIENKHSIEVDFDKPGFFQKENYIIGANYDTNTKKTTLIFNNQKVCKIDFSNTLVKQHLIYEIKHHLVHENTHHQQNQNLFKNQSYNTNQMVMTKDYISQFQEIPAFAREIAFELSEVLQTSDSKKILDAIIYNKPEIKTIKNYNYIQDFKEIGGPVYRKFLVEIYNYFQEI